MNSKLIIKMVLLIFVLGSVAYLIADEFIFKTPANSEKAEAAAEPIPASPKPLSAVLPAEQQPAEKVVLYYFHGTVRCMTCKKFESYTNQVLEDNFTEAINNGSLELRIVNVDEPENKHFVNDYKLYTKSIVLVKTQDGKQVEWKNLDRIWKVVKDKAVFMDYVTGEINSYLETE